METREIAFKGALTALELEELIGELIKARATMAPPVPDKPEDAPDRTVLEQNPASFTVRTLADGGLRIWLRNDGLGWLAFQLDQEQRQGLAEFLSKPPSHTLSSH